MVVVSRHLVGTSDLLLERIRSELWYLLRRGEFWFDVDLLCYRLWNWFSAVDTDRSGAITAPELGALSCFLDVGVLGFGNDVLMACNWRRARIDQWRLDS